MKKGLHIHYDEDRELRWWVTIWKTGRIITYKHIGKTFWVNDEQTNFPEPTPSSVGRCLRLLEKLNKG